MKKIDVSIVIVSYNTLDYLRNCLNSLYSAISDKVSFEIIVIDNDSTDGSREMLHKDFKHVTAIENTNEGFAKANNRGVGVSKGRYVLFLNPDTIMSKGVIEEVVKFMDQNDEVGASTCKLVMENGELDYAARRGFPTPWNSITYFSGLAKVFPTSKLFSGYTMGWENSSEPHEVDSLAGAFMMTRRTAGDQVGWWDEDYFFNGEDIDFCYRLKQKNWKIYYLPHIAILHYNGVSGGTKKSSQHITTANKTRKQFVTKARFDAMRIFYKKHYTKKYPKLITWGIFKGISLKQWLTMRRIGN